MTRAEREVRDAYDSVVDDQAEHRLNRFIEELAASPTTNRQPTARRQRRWVPVAVIGAVAASAFVITESKHRHGTSTAATSSHASTPSTGSSSAAQKALRQWMNFPVTVRPRPLVLTGDAVQSPQAFRTGGAKVSFLEGNFALATRLPSAPTRSGGWPITSAADALSVLRGNQFTGPQSAPEKITRVWLTTSQFSTDRGRRTLPAWAFTMHGGTTPAYVLAVQPSSRWPHTIPTAGPTDPNVTTADSVTIGGDDRQLTVHFWGGQLGTGPCGASYVVHTTQSPTAIVIGINYVPAPSTASAAVTCTADLHSRTVTTTIDRPVGNRVLIDTTGAPLPGKSA